MSQAYVWMVQCLFFLLPLRSVGINVRKRMKKKNVHLPEILLNQLWSEKFVFIVSSISVFVMGFGMGQKTHGTTEMFRCLLSLDISKENCSLFRCQRIMKKHGIVQWFPQSDQFFLEISIFALQMPLNTFRLEENGDQK